MYLFIKALHTVKIMVGAYIKKPSNCEEGGKEMYSSDQVYHILGVQMVFRKRENKKALYATVLCKLEHVKGMKCLSKKERDATNLR